MMMRKRVLQGAMVAGLLMAAGAEATVLDFSGLGLSNWDPIPQSYGDRTGDTLNVEVSYSIISPTGATSPDYSVSYWESGYGDLTDVAFSYLDGWYAQITLTPDAGYDVILNGFDMAGWEQVDLDLDSLQVVSASGAVLWDSGASVIHGAGPTHDSFAPNVISSGPITIVWGTNYNIGIDNISFSQRLTPTGAVPEPAVIALMGLGLVGIGFQRRRAVAG